MATPILKVEKLSKRFTILHEEQEKYTALRDVMAKQAKKIISLPQRLRGVLPNKSTKEDFWALSDVSFDVYAGDRVGIIGRNGAGKSTLLKILSRITEPTNGRISIGGRIASLLEVGTGFHPELTGRENIYLNGAILGMTRAEIKAKFDEIVDFSEVERFLDTPVKRYSSGMYVRLAFAVAAHLEPEILIVDEVLAVGDSQFQKKCLGKMEDVSKEGRTVLFVSHSMGTLKSLCSSILYLKNGQLIKQGGVEETIKEYLAENQKVIEAGNIPRDLHRKYGTGDALIDSIKLRNFEGIQTNEFHFGEQFKIEMEFTVEKKLGPSTIQFIIATQSGENVLSINDSKDGVYQFREYEVGVHKVTVNMTSKFLPIGFNISAFIATENGTPVDWVEHVVPFSVSNVSIKQGADYPWNLIHGYVEQNPIWNYSK
jgi:lipopolysaccharide transport system ATP-binding protein